MLTITLRFLFLLSVLAVLACGGVFFSLTADARAVLRSGVEDIAIAGQVIERRGPKGNRYISQIWHSASGQYRFSTGILGYAEKPQGSAAIISRVPGKPDLAVPGSTTDPFLLLAGLAGPIDWLFCTLFSLVALMLLLMAMGVLTAISSGFRAFFSTGPSWQIKTDTVPVVPVVIAGLALGVVVVLNPGHPRLPRTLPPIRTSGNLRLFSWGPDSVVLVNDELPARPHRCDTCIIDCQRYSVQQPDGTLLHEYLYLVISQINDTGCISLFRYATNYYGAHGHLIDSTVHAYHQQSLPAWQFLPGAAMIDITTQDSVFLFRKGTLIGRSTVEHTAQKARTIQRTFRLLRAGRLRENHQPVTVFLTNHPLHQTLRLSVAPEYSGVPLWDDPLRWEMDSYEISYLPGSTPETGTLISTRRSHQP